MTTYPIIRSYQENQLAGEIRLPDSGSAEAFGAIWSCGVKQTPAAGEGDDVELEFCFTVLSGGARSAGLAVVFEFKDWSADDYLFLPSAVYQGNDFQVMDVPYPPLWRDARLFRPDMPVTTTPVPCFGSQSNKLEQTTGDTASPCMGFHSPGRRMGFLVQTTQGSRFGNHGLTVERTPCGGIRFMVTAPCVREFRQDHCKAMPSMDRAVDWLVGDTLTLRFRRVVFPAERLQTLFERYGEIRKSLNPTGHCEELPFSAAWKIVEEKYNRDNWVEDCGYYKMAPNDHTTFQAAENPLCFLWQIGWTGGGMMSMPMLAEGKALTGERAWRTLEMIFDKTQAPSGFFYGIGDGQRFYSDGFDRPHPHHMHLIRKSGDWLYFALKHFDLFRKQGREIPHAWEQSIRRLSDAFVRLFDRSGQFGQFVDVETGELLVGGSTSGGIIPGALARAAGWFGNPDFLRVADASARAFYQDAVCKGLTVGGPGEILSAPDSESVFALLESFVALWEATGDPFYAIAARETAAQAASWVVSYDHRFPAGSLLARAGAHTTGAVFANIQNKHGSPGICTLSGDSLFRLWRATGDPLALGLILDIARGIPQYLSREDKPLGPSMQPGWMCERVNLSDWETPEGVGGNLFGSCSWGEASLMLTCWEIPGLYVQPDSGVFHVFDHIKAVRLAAPEGVMLLRVSNPTRFDAEIKVMCETSDASAEPLGVNPLFDCPRLKIPANRSVTVEFTLDGMCLVSTDVRDEALSLAQP